MKLLPFQYLININIIAGLVGLFSEILIGIYSIELTLILLIIIISTFLASKYSPFKNFKIKPLTLSLVLIISSILLTFSPYLFQFTDIEGLIYISVSVSFVMLMSLIFCNLTLDE
jgi:hypothetical protein